MLNGRLRYIVYISAFCLSLLLTGCNNPLPPNEHVGKAPANNYKDGYYGDYYYHGRHYY